MLRPAKNPLGYNTLGIGLLVLFIAFICGCLFAAVALWRGEQPKLLPAIALLINLGALAWLSTFIY